MRLYIRLRGRWTRRGTPVVISVSWTPDDSILPVSSALSARVCCSRHFPRRATSPGERFVRFTTQLVVVSIEPRVHRHSQTVVSLADVDNWPLLMGCEHAYQSDSWPCCIHCSSSTGRSASVSTYVNDPHRDSCSADKSIYFYLSNDFECQYIR